MKTIYQTTRAGWYDTQHIAKQKFLQQVRQPNTDYAGLVAEPTSTDPKFHDTKLITLQKMLTSIIN